MEVSRAEDGGQNEEQADACIEGEANDTEEKGLAQGAAESEYVADEEELSDLVMVSNWSQVVLCSAAMHLPWWTVASSGECSQQWHVDQRIASCESRRWGSIPTFVGHSRGTGNGSVHSN